MKLLRIRVGCKKGELVICNLLSMNSSRARVCEYKNFHLVPSTDSQERDRMNDRLATPTAHVRPHEITIHGHTRVDDYFWLREKGDPEVIEYLDAENEYAQSMTAHLDGGYLDTYYMK